MQQIPVLDLSCIDPYCVALSVSCICVRALRKHPCGPRCSYWELVDRHGTASYLRALASHGVDLARGKVYRLDGLGVRVDTDFSSLSPYVICTTPQTRFEEDTHANIPQERQIVPSYILCTKLDENANGPRASEFAKVPRPFRMNDIQGLVVRVDCLTQKRASAHVGDTRVFTGPGCPRLAPGQFVRLFGVSRMAADRVYVADPASQIVVSSSSSRGAVPVEELKQYRRQKAPITVDLVGRLATDVKPQGPPVRTIELRGQTGNGIELNVMKVPVSELKKIKTGECMRVTSVRVCFRSKTTAFWTPGTSRCALETS